MRLAQLSIYPLGEPRHGGQLRCAAIRAAYRAQGIEVHGLAAMHEDAYRNERRGEDIALPATWPGWRADLPRFADLQSGICLAGEATAWRRFKAWLDALEPDVIALEQPWLWPAVERWLGERPAQAPRPRLVYSSQNIEWCLKRDEVDACQPAQRQAIAAVEALERSLAGQADLLVACTEADLAALREMAGAHAAQARFVTAPNAIAPFEASPARLAAMRKRLGRERWPLFVGSAHPPNASGFWDMLAPSLAFLQPEEQIIVAGGVSHLIRGDRRYQAWSGINEPRLALLGEVTREELSALLHGASVILLPITTGGGSNLKTAEAIYTGKPVLATPHALRGYGDATQWPTIRVADSADAFRRALRNLMDQPAVAEPAAYATVRERVTWDRALAPLTAAITSRSSANAHPPGFGTATHGLTTIATAEETATRIAAIAARVERNGGVDYEALLERQYTRFIRQGDVVVDVGAHAGRHLARFAKLVGPSGRVVGFEPLPQMYATLTHRFCAPNIEVYNVALTDRSGRMEFVHAKGAPEESGLRERVYNHPDAVEPVRIEVQVERLDHYAGQLGDVRFIKIDVEGAEISVLEGALDLLGQCRPWLSVEYGRPAYRAYGHQRDTLYELAERIGYCLYDVFGHPLDRAAWAVACDSVYWDYFLIPTEQRGAFERAVPALGPEAID